MYVLVIRLTIGNCWSKYMFHMLTATYIKKHMANYSSLCVDSTRVTLGNDSIFDSMWGIFMDNFSGLIKGSFWRKYHYQDSILVVHN